MASREVQFEFMDEAREDFGFHRLRFLDPRPIQSLACAAGN